MEAPDTTRFQLIVHYDGSAFRGWQFQPDQRTVQGDLQAALSTLADAPTTVIGSGRTDTGVHATGQVASVDMPARWTTAKLRKAMNATLPREIWVESVRRAALDFHPRYDAVARRYTYRVGLDEHAQSPFQRSQCWALGEALDRERLASAAERLLGRHSFEAFAKAGHKAPALFDADPFGLHLYHCHANPLKRHVHKGLYGAFIVDPPSEVARPPADELVMVLNGLPIVVA